MFDLKRYLQLALEAAHVRRGFCAPNPAVGAVLVKENQVIATGMHWGAGHPHAEVEAIRRAGDAVKGADLYVTLEPCCHHGRTPPCTDLIIQSSIRRVIFGFRDPNPIAQNGSDVLRQAGVDCEFLSMPAIDRFYQSYAYWIQHSRPWVTLKLAVSADDKIADAEGKPLLITGDACHQFTHHQRAQSDAILTTVETILNDDPQMNARLPEKTIAKPLFVLDSHLRLERGAKIFKTAKSVTVYHREDVPMRADFQCVPVPFDEKGLHLESVLKDIGRRGYHDVWVEVGARAFRSFYQNKLANRIVFYRSEKTAGDCALPAFSDIHPFKECSLQWERLGDDWMAEIRFD